MQKKIYIRGHLMVKKRFIEAILSGRKKTTIRLGKVIPKVKDIIIHSGGRPIAKAIIKNVIYKKISELTNDDAHRDGYENIDELIKDLEKIYRRKISPNDIVTIIEFDVVKRIDDIDMNDIYLGFSPLDIAKLAHRYLNNVLSEEELRIIDALLRYKSIRETSIKLFGNLEKRWKIRRVLRKSLALLIEKHIIKVNSQTLEKLSTIAKWYRGTLSKNDS